MQIRIFDSTEECLWATAWQFIEAATSRPETLIGMATGSTTKPVHGMIADFYQKHPFDTSRITTLNVDDYLGIANDHPASASARMKEQLYDALSIPPDRGITPDCMPESEQAECDRLEQLIMEKGGIGLQILGVGADAHLGFCVPGTPFGNRTYVAQISSVLRGNMMKNYGMSDEEVPTTGITLGLKTIMQCEKPVCVVTGLGKAEAVANSILGPVTEEVPASILQLHRNTVWYLDKAAAEGIAGKVDERGILLDA
ncbi:glucosamine-6-phosphate deaminase [Eubacteriales bacterium OttesenSCG-928-M02]|nr:glucosamine-6-phosphate deaminase [Eubacteriales bacterium OttesenSCG-928-M02]